ncbi:MAG: DUF4476 domain-containing protein [Bacteroidia bacterium]|nr:DUF4476 domain-containing protein [Bacteroidia bacterium]
MRAIFIFIFFLQLVYNQCFAGKLMGVGEELCKSRQASCAGSEIIPREDFRAIYGIISQQGTDAERVQMLRRLLIGNCFSANQITQLLGLVGYENQRFYLAQESFPYIINPDDYQVIIKTFTFAQYQKELALWWENELAAQHPYLRK